MEQTNLKLRLVRESEYEGGEPYRDWELLVDAPEIPASGRYSASPPHAIVGDTLREELDEDGLTPFQLRRKGRRIGNPEWWQVRHLFEGVRTGLEPGGPPPSAEAPGLLQEVKASEHHGWRFLKPWQWEKRTIPVGAWLIRRGVDYYVQMDPANKSADTMVETCRFTVHDFFQEDQLARNPHYRHAVDILRATLVGWQWGVAYMERPLAPLGLRRGDVLVYVPSEERMPAQPLGRTRLLSMDDYATIREAAEADSDLFTEILSPCESRGVRGFLNNKNKWGERLKVWHSRLMVVRPYDLSRTVTHPVRARCDEGAIFELLVSTGGRMPRQDAEGR